MSGIRHVEEAFRPALIIVDVQEDFCPPNGSLAVDGGRDIAPMINALLDYPFTLKVATKDFHPPDHVSFAKSHPSPDIVAFQSSISISNPQRFDQQQSIPLWPVHCVQGSMGADIIPELAHEKLDVVVEKGRDRDVESFSPFADVFGNKSTTSTNVDLSALLKSKNITHVFAVGIAGDYCVRCTAMDAQKEGFEVLVVEEAVRSVDPSEKGWGAARTEMASVGIKVIPFRGPEISRVLSLR